MKIACFIPIKQNSERVPGKNLRYLNGKKLYEYICEHALEAKIFDDIFVDTNSTEIRDYITNKGIKYIEREPELALNSANGNDLLVKHFELFPDYDYYFQLFATAPFLQAKSIKESVESLIYSEKHDSCFTAIEKHDFCWFGGMPINYRPSILPRSQDMPPIIEETTGLYGICRESLDKYRCRVGKNPYAYIVDKYEAVDINTETDFKIAEMVGKVVFGEQNLLENV